MGLKINDKPIVFGLTSSELSLLQNAAFKKAFLNESHFQKSKI